MNETKTYFIDLCRFRKNGCYGKSVAVVAVVAESIQDAQRILADALPKAKGSRAARSFVGLLDGVTVSVGGPAESVEMSGVLTLADLK